MSLMVFLSAFPGGYGLCSEKILGVIFDQFSSSSRSFASYFITLIPKSISLAQLSDFIPIYLVGSLYKLVVKVLDGRLDEVMVGLFNLISLPF